MAHHWRLDAGGNHDGAAGDLLGAVLYWPLGLESADMKTYEMAREAGLWPAVTDTFPKELQHFAALVAAAEREAIYDQWHSCVMADLENGVKWLNEKAAAEWHKNYPAQSNLFPAWIEARENT